MATVLYLVLLASAGAQPSGDAAPVQPSRQQSGSIRQEDYPEAALQVRAEGTTEVRLVVGPDGRVTGCAVAASSGNAALDSTTCALAQRRLRFAPALDAAGRPTTERRTHRVAWRAPGETPLSPGAMPESD